jgi:hypothetical protein
VIGLSGVSSICTELEHSQIIRHRYLQGQFDVVDLLYKGKFWLSKSDCQGLPREKRRDYTTYGYSTSPVTFCLDCIKESIREYGFGYFKAVWWRSHWCRIHQKHLSVLCSEGKHFSQDIRKILSGQSVPSMEVVSNEHFFQYGDKPFNLSIDSSFGLFITQVNFDYGIPRCIEDIYLFDMSPCFGSKFFSWFVDNIEVFKQHELSRGCRTWLNLFGKDRSVKYRYSYATLIDYVDVFFNFLSQESIDKFREFVSTHSFFDEDNDVLLLKRMNCSKCPNLSWSKECSRGLDIVRYRLTPPVIMRNNIKSFNRFMERIGSDSRRTHTCEELKDRSIESDIGSVFELNDRDYLCPGLQPTTHDLAKHGLTLLGWADLENINHTLESSAQWQVDYPLYSDVPIYVVDESDGINGFWPEIPFNQYVSWGEFMYIEHEHKSKPAR